MSCRGLGWQIGRGARAPKGKEKGGIESASRTHLDVHGLLVGLELAACKESRRSPNLHHHGVEMDQDESTGGI